MFPPIDPSILAVYLLYLSVPISPEVDNMLKTTLFIAALLLLASCSTVKSGSSKQRASATTTTTSSNGSIQFIDNISVTPSGRQDKSGSSISPVTGSAGSRPSGVTSGAG